MPIYSEAGFYIFSQHKAEGIIWRKMNIAGERSFMQVQHNRFMYDKKRGAKQMKLGFSFSLST